MVLNYCFSTAFDFFFMSLGYDCTICLLTMMSTTWKKTGGISCFDFGICIKNLQYFASLFSEILLRFLGETMELNMLLNPLAFLPRLRKLRHTWRFVYHFFNNAICSKLCTFLYKTKSWGLCCLFLGWCQESGDICTFSWCSHVCGWCKWEQLWSQDERCF